MNIFDLQMHSTASDGEFSPAELVTKAKDSRLNVIALTDHDTVQGVEEAKTAGGELGIEVIPGVELSANHGELGLHILGYGIDIKNAALLAASEKIRLSRIARAKEMVKRLRKQGFKISYEDVAKRARGGMVMRPHIAFEILENPENKEVLGGAETKGDFIRSFLVSGKPAYVESRDLNFEQAVAIIHGAKGVAVWSHPAVHFPETFDGLENALKELVALGLDGVEVFNSSHTESAVRFLHELARARNLLFTAGSDFEVEPKTDISDGGPRGLGDYQTYGFATDEIIPRLKEAMAAAAAAAGENR